MGHFRDPTMMRSTFAIVLVSSTDKASIDSIVKAAKGALTSCTLVRIESAQAFGDRAPIKCGPESDAFQSMLLLPNRSSDWIDRPILPHGSRSGSAPASSCRPSAIRTYVCNSRPTAFHGSLLGACTPLRISSLPIAILAGFEHSGGGTPAEGSQDMLTADAYGLRLCARLTPIE